MTFKLAHITDVHMGPLPAFGPKYWNLKRTLGVLNWQRGRKTAHRPEIFAALVQDMAAQKPDHIALTGDLTNIGLPAEHIRALDWLQDLGGPPQVSVVPGNHDIYTDLGDDPGALRWLDYMGGTAPEDINGGQKQSGNPTNIRAADAASHFPFLRRFGDIALIGVNSAIPTRPFMADGKLGRAQRERLAQMLDETGAAGLIKIVMIHHPPLPGQAAPSRGLRDCEELAQILERHGAHLVLHGHNHQNMFQLIRHCSADGEQSAIPVIGAPSASMARRHHGEPLARYNLYGIERTQIGVRIELVGRGFDQPGGSVIELERRRIDLSPQAAAP